MKKIAFSLLLAGMVPLMGLAQQSVSIGTDQINSNAVLWLQGNGSQGLILPVVTNRTNVTATKGMIVFDDSDKKVYFNNGSAWVEVGGSGGGTAQTLTLSGNTLSISGGNSVQIASTAPTLAGQLLQWNGTQWTTSNATAPTTGQVLKWNGTTWAPGTDNTGGSSIILNNGQLLTGNGTANSATTITGDVTLSGANMTIANNAVNSAKIADGSISASDLGPMGATNGQIMKFNGTAWVPSADDAGVGATPTLANGQILIGNGTTNSAATLSGDATLNTGALTIANNAINSAKIADGTVTSADIADGSILATDLGDMGATNGQVLQYNGTDWNPATLTGSGTVTSVSATAPLSVTTPTTTPAISISQATSTTNGFLSSVDWAAFNAKLGPATTTGGDLSGTVISPTVVGIQGRAVTNTVPTNGQILKFNGTSWAPAADDVGGGATPTLSDGQILIGNGTSNSGVALSGDATLSAGALTIANNAINSAKIADGTIQAADLNSMGATANQILQYNGTNWAPALLPVTTGTVTSVGLTLPSIFSVTGSPVTTSGTLNATLASQAAGTVFAAPAGSAGAPTFRALTATDIPSLDAAKITTGIIPVAQGGTGANSPSAALTNLGAMSNTLNTGEIFVGSATNVATPVAVSGDATLSTAGTLTIANNAITSTKILDGSIVDSDVNATAAIAGTKIAPNFGAQLIQSTAGADINLTGADPTTININAQASSGNSTGISSRAIGSSIANFGVFGSASGTGSNYGLYGSATGAAGNNYGLYGTALNGATNWAGYFEGRLGLTSAFGVGAPGSENFGTAGQVLTSAGPGAPPTWSTAGGGFGTLNVIPKGDGTTLVASTIFDDGTHVGIGTSSPTTNLEVFAASPTLQMHSSGNSSQIEFINSGSGTIGSIGDPGSSEDLQISATNRLFLNTNFATRMAVDINGRVGFGTITPIESIDLVGNLRLTGGIVPANSNFFFAGGNAITSGVANFGWGGGTAITTGNYNVILGNNAGFNITGGGSNILMGTNSGSSLVGTDNNVFIGSDAGTLATGNSNLAIGAGSEVAAGINNASAVGPGATVSVSNRMVLGAPGVGIQFNGELRPADNPGTAGQVLTSAGPGAAPVWAAGGGGSLQAAYTGGNTITLGASPIDITGTAGQGAIRATDSYIETVDAGADEDAWFRSTSGTSWLFGANSLVHSGGFGIGIFGDMLFPPFFIDPVNKFIGVGGEVSPSSALDVIGAVEFTGALLPNNNAGTAGQILTSQGAGVAPAWTTPSGSVLIGNPGTRNLFAGAPINAVNSGPDNSFFGSSAGIANTSGNRNTFLGAESGFSTTTGSENTYIGRRAGYSGTSGYNTYVGKNAGYFNTASSAGLNTFVGWHAAYNYTGTNGGSVMIGASAGAGDGVTAPTGDYNTFVGERSGENSTSGQLNTFIGRISGDANTSGSSNTLLGAVSDVGSGNLTNATAIGFRAMVSQSNSLVLGSINGVNGASANTNVGIGTATPSERLHVIGNILASGTITPSDLRFKKDIHPLDNVLSKVSNINGVTYYYRNDEFPEQGFNSELQIGVIAQELEKVYPELVTTNSTGYKFVDYSKLTPILVEAIKELKKENELLVEKFNLLKSENQTLKSENGSLESKVAAIEAQQQSLAKSLEEIKQLLGAEAKK